MTEALSRRFFNVPSIQKRHPYVCPHGRATRLIIQLSEIMKFVNIIAMNDVIGLKAMEYDYEAGAGGYQFHELKLASCFRGEEYGVSSVSFDPQEDLLWAATYEVRQKLSPNACPYTFIFRVRLYRVT